MSAYPIDYIVVSVVSGLVGFVLGYVTKSYLNKQNRDLDKNMIVLIAVTSIWTLSMIVDISSSTYETSPLLHGLMGVIVGFFFKPSISLGGGGKHEGGGSK